MSINSCQNGPGLVSCKFTTLKTKLVDSVEAPKKVGIRLSQGDVEQIVKVICAQAQNARLDLQEISLFGSRTNLNAKGGDIDLYVRFSLTEGQEINDLKIKLKILDGLYLALGEQKIDLILDFGLNNLGVFVQIINEGKVTLWNKTEGECFSRNRSTS